MNRVIFCIFLCFSLHVSGVEIVRDSNGFVKLFYHADQPHTATLLSWEKSPNGYGRPVTAIKMKANKELSAQEAKTFWINKVNDKNSVTLVEKSQIEIKSDLILNEKIMDRTILSSVRQIEGGASQYSSLDADQYINKNSLSLAQYTREMNIQLTRTLGAEFSSQVYKSLLLRETKTQDSMQLFTALLESNLQAKDTQFDGATELWVAKGLMQNTEDVEKVKGMFEKVLALMAEKGLPVFTFKTRTGDTVQTNADIIASTLENRTTNNRKIVILAVSKAVPEVLGGLAKLNTKGFFDKTENKGLISGVILTAGPQNGMHFADFASMPLVFSIIKNKKKGHIS